MSRKAEVQTANILRSDFPTFCKHFFVIKNKQGRLVPFELNAAQLFLWKQVRKLEREGKPVRIIILKARQMGMSTMIQAYMLWKALTQPGTDALVVAHQEDAASELFGKIEMMYRELPGDLLGELEGIRDAQRRGKKLAFAGDLNTMLYVDTAGNPSLGRSQTFQRVHLSELAFYDKADEIMFGLEQSIPEDANTAIFIESTANGMGNYFHKKWKRSKDGESGYAPVFLPWHWHEEYRRKVPSDFSLSREERRLKKKYGLDDEQIAWMRHNIEVKCDGDEEKFHQENPGDENDAFMISGSPYFNRKALEFYHKVADAPENAPEREGNFVYGDGKARFEEYDNGPWQVWKNPSKNRPYVIGADVAGGTARDFSSAHVFDPISLEVCASYKGKLDPDEFAYQLKWMGIAYNHALIAPEKNGEGRATLLKLHKDLEYPHIFFHQHADSWSGGVQRAWGWSTTSRTRPTMIAQLSELLRKKEVKLYCKRTVQDLQSFVRVDTSKIAEAAEGAWDDMVMSLAIAVSSEVRVQGITIHGYDNPMYDNILDSLLGGVSYE